MYAHVCPWWPMRNESPVTQASSQRASSDYNGLPNLHDPRKLNPSN